MIYLIQDCYKDEDNNYIDILKIGYSDKPLMESKSNQYKTRELDARFDHNDVMIREYKVAFGVSINLRLSSKM